MKIVIITPYWINTKGGIGTVVYNLYNELKRHGYSVYVLATDNGQQIIKLPNNRFMLVWKMIRVLCNIKPDAIHVHAHSNLLRPAIVYKIFFNRKVKVIFTFHTQPHTVSFLGDTKPLNMGCGYTFRRAIFNYTLKQCNAVTYVSRSLMESLYKIGIGAGNRFIIPNGVEIKKFSRKDVVNFKEKYNLFNAYPVICMVAILVWDWKVKGVEILIKAFKNVLKSQLNAKLLIIGDGQYRKYLEGIVKKENLLGKVIFTGNMDNPFIALSVCDIYCHISLNEAFGVAPLEAMLAGKPVIASNSGGLPEFIRNGFNGILVESNPESVAKSFLSLIENPELMRKLSVNAISTAENGILVE